MTETNKPLTLSEISIACRQNNISEEAFEEYANQVADLLEGGKAETFILVDETKTEMVEGTEEMNIQVLSSGMLDDEKTLWAFSSEEILNMEDTDYLPESTSYMTMNSDELFSFAAQNEFKKIVIDYIFTFHAQQ